MTHYKNSNSKTNKDKLEHDEYLENVGASRVNRSHGGELLEAISSDELVTVNDPASCEHSFELDPTEELGTAYVCIKPKCGIVVIQ